MNALILMQQHVQTTFTFQQQKQNTVKECKTNLRLLCFAVVVVGCLAANRLQSLLAEIGAPSARPPAARCA